MALSIHFLPPLFVLFLLSTTSAQDSLPKIAGYSPDSDVTEHAEIDLDQEEMEDLTDLFEWGDAKGIYANGKNSDKSDSKRTLSGFSTTAGEKMKDEPYFKIYRDYWGRDDYADYFVRSALDGSNDFQSVGNMFRAECANKGSQYQNVWMYVIHEMEDAINDCNNDDLNDNDKGVRAWDEAWAFWVGSTIDEDGTNAGEGFLGYTLAHKRAADYGTTNAQGAAKVNVEMLRLFNQGKGQLEGDSCEAARTTKDEIVKQMTIPLVQGIIRYVVQTRDGVDGDVDEEELGKRHGEGWAFSAAALPRINECDQDVAERLVKNFEPTADPPMKDGIKDVMRDLQSVYGCLGFTCEDVGKNDDREGDCPIGSSSGLSGGAIAGIVIAVLVVSAVIGFLYFRHRGKKAAGLPTAADMQAAAQEPFTV